MIKNTNIRLNPRFSILACVALIAGLAGCSRLDDFSVLTSGGRAPGGGAGRFHNISFLAGGLGGSGSADGAGADARFNIPVSVARDGAGNVYVGDHGNNTIRKITSGGVVTTFAGTAGATGSIDGIGAAAKFCNPNGVAVDGLGNVYVADNCNSTIRKISSDGVVTTLAGKAGTPGSTDGTGGAARFDHPRGVAVDGSGNVYVSDMGNEIIRKITTGGVVTTLAGTAGSAGTTDGTGAVARFTNPYGIAVDSLSGNIYVTDSINSTIRQITSEGIVTTFAGTAGDLGNKDGTGTAARFDHPRGVAVDGSGNIYVSDMGNNTIRKITSGGVVTTLAGTAGSTGSTDGTGAAARFSSPSGVAVDSSGNAYVADLGNQIIRQITSGGVVTTFAGKALTLDSTDGTGAAAGFNTPKGVAVDSSGNIYLADSVNSTIRKITSAGVVTTVAGTAGMPGTADGTGEAAGFNTPTGIGVDGSGNIYVADSINSTIRMITSGGVVTTLAGAALTAGSANGAGADARFNNPQGVAVDASGNVYVADQNNRIIRMINSGGVVTTLAGTAGAFGNTDGTGADARFGIIKGIAVDGVGNVYVTDLNTVRKITSGGVVTTLAGASGIIGNIDGAGAAARFNAPIGLTVDGSGNVYVADRLNSIIRKISPEGVVTTVAGTAGVLGVLPSTLSYPVGLAIFGSTLFTTSENAVLAISL